MSNSDALDPITDAMIQDLPSIVILPDPRLNRITSTARPVTNGLSTSANLVNQNGTSLPVTPAQKRIGKKPKKVIPPKQTLFYELVSNDRMHLSYLCEVKPKVGQTAASESQAAINSIDFSPDGNFLAGSTGEDTIIVLDLKQSRPGKSINPVKKYGANLIKMLINHTAVHSSTRTDNDLRLLDLAYHNYVRYFKGHTGLVCSLDVTSTARTIISAAGAEKKVFLWDIDQLKPTACLKLATGIPALRQWTNAEFGNDFPNMKPRNIAFPQPVVAFDPTNTVFAVAARESPEYVRLFDLRNYSKGPFKTWTYNLMDKIYEQFPTNGSLDARMCAITGLGADFTDIKFSPDGKLLLLNTSGPYFYIMDSFTGKLKRTILRDGRTYNNSFLPNRAPEVSWSPDSEYLIGGSGSSSDPRIYCWNVRSGKVVAILNQDSKTDDSNLNLAIHYVRHSPVSCTIAAAGGQRISLYRSTRPQSSSNQPADGDQSDTYSSMMTF